MTTRTSDLVETMLRKPGKKPDFRMPLPQSSILSQVKDFLPELQASTSKIEEHNHEMGIEITETKED